ncbi:MAG: transposase [Polyangiaceae bacterium]|nr:transposase [Polyangiaceae bacterium]
MTDDTNLPARMRWARLRFGIIAPLLTAPPEDGELGATIAALAARPWRHPTTGETVRFSAKTIERWFYVARADPQPIEALARKVPRHAGTHPSISPAVEEALRTLRRQHPRWSYQLVHDNLVALGRERPDLGVLPGYATVCRFMKHHGFGKHRKPRRHEREPGFVPRERRSFEVAHVHALWHCDFHDAKRKVLTASGEREIATLFGVLDDRSRVCCHAQWYLGDECTESFVHGLSQAFQKRGLPRALLSDNGSPMTAAETIEGLERLSIEHHTTLAETPEQNGKQEVFWAQVEGRLMAMLEGEPELTLELLNRATQAWVEHEYHRRVHSETGQTPLDRWLAGPSVGRPCPSSDTLRRVFRMQVSRTQRRSDGTVTVASVRYELPSAYRTLLHPTLRVARWDLSSVDLVDPRRGTHLATLLPVDKERNADRRRRALADPAAGARSEPVPPPSGTAPLLRQYMAEYAATGLPPAYVPLDRTLTTDDTDDTDDEDLET